MVLQVCLPDTVATNTHVNNCHSRQYETFLRTVGAEELFLPNFEAAIEILSVLSANNQLRVSKPIAGGPKHVSNSICEAINMINGARVTQNHMHKHNQGRT